MAVGAEGKGGIIGGPQDSGNTGRVKVLCAGGNSHQFQLGRVRFVMYLNFLGTSQVCAQLECAEKHSGLTCAFNVGEKPLE